MKIIDKIFKRKSHAIDKETLRKMGIETFEPERIKIEKFEYEKFEYEKINLNNMESQ